MTVGSCAASISALRARSRTMFLVRVNCRIHDCEMATSPRVARSTTMHKPSLDAGHHAKHSGAQHWPGLCGVVHGPPGDCLSSPHGWFPEPTEDVHHCIQRCRNCEQCAYVSFAKSSGDCTWFSQCELRVADANRLSRHDSSYISARVKNQSNSRQSRMRPAKDLPSFDFRVAYYLK